MSASGFNHEGTGLLVNKPITVFAFLLLAPLLGCSSRERVNEHLVLHRDFAAFQEKLFTETEVRVGKYVQALLKNYVFKSNCQFDSTKAKSSIYVPKSGTKGNMFNCLMDAARTLDSLWEEDFSRIDYVSWFYFYDDLTKTLRIFPTTDTYALFGDDLSFSNFHFFKNAVEKFPLGAWSNTRVDVNGTGKIVIFSQALKVPGSSKYTVVSTDIRTSHIQRPFEGRLFEYSKKYSDAHAFMFAYHAILPTTSLAYEFSTDQTKWKMLMPLNGIRPRMNANEKAKFDELESSAKADHSKVVSAKLAFDGREYFCSMSLQERMSLNTVFCHET